MDTLFSDWLLYIGPLLFVAGIGSAADAVLRVKNPQGATAWIVGLVTVPFITLPLYWMFGRSKDHAYRESRQRTRERMDVALRGETGLLSQFRTPEYDLNERDLSERRAFEGLATTPLCGGHALTLLVDGDATFNAIFEAIDSARNYVLVQFFIIRDDRLGRQLHAALLRARERNCRVYVQYDEIGSYQLGDPFLKELRDAGVHALPFAGTSSLLGRFRINFRNHRKIVVVDGHIGFLGGLNVGVEYLGESERFDQWRDTHLRIEGPTVLGLQQSFIEDWCFGQEDGEFPEVVWTPARSPEGRIAALISSTGPADDIESCGLLFAHAIESAEHRLWIASPYFVPDQRVLSSLQVAALRGVDVRVLLPRQSDNPIFHFVPYAYLADIERLGVQIFLYEAGFMHQKVTVVDDAYTLIGSANLDNRSFRLNFEVTCVAKDERFVADVARMLEDDFNKSTRLTHDDVANKPWYFTLAVSLTRLMAPVL